MTITLLYLQLLATGIITSIACSIPGTFLILRGTSLISDAISHAILLGIVLSFLLLKTVHMPLLFIGATLTALITIWLIEKIINTKLLHSDAVIGIIFPALFSIAVLLINIYAHNIHLDIDAVLLGEIALSPLYQIKLLGMNIGSQALWIMLIIMIINIIILKLWYKNLIISSFDNDYAALMNYNPQKTYWILMLMTCITILGAFEAVGAILVVAFIITPAAIAYLISKNINQMLLLGCALGILGVTSGCFCAHYWNVSIAGSIASMYSVIFLVVLLLTQQLKRLGK